MGEKAFRQKPQKPLFYAIPRYKRDPYDPIDISFASSVSSGPDHLAAIFSVHRIAACPAMRRRFAWF
jgi:hypothetical protein